MDSLQPARGPSRPGAEPGGIVRYLRTVRSHYKLIVACAVVCLVGAFVYVKLAPRTYTATAQMAVNPAAAANTLLFGLPVLHTTGDPTEDVLTAASLLHTPSIAQPTVTALHLRTSANGLLGKISIVPVGESEVVAISAKASTATLAQSIANTYANEAVAVRTANLHAAIATQLPGLKAQVAKLPSATAQAAGGLGQQVTQLEQLATSPDPTISVSSAATLPLAPSSPNTKLTLVAGLLIGILLGTAGAFGIDAIDPAVRREEQLQERFGRIPVLARIPHHVGAVTANPLTPLELPAYALEQYRQLRTTLGAASARGPVAYLMTGSWPGEGKTTSAINLATVLAQSGARVILIEADLRRPTLARTLNLKRYVSTDAVLDGEAELAEALHDVRVGPAHFCVLAAREHHAESASRLSPMSASQLLESAKQLADVVIVDSPPVTAVVDGLTFAQEVDRVVVAVRIGHTKLAGVAEALDLLDNQGAEVAGFILVDVRRTGGVAYGYTYPAEQEPTRLELADQSRNRTDAQSSRAQRAGGAQQNGPRGQSSGDTQQTGARGQGSGGGQRSARSGQKPPRGQGQSGAHKPRRSARS